MGESTSSPMKVLLSLSSILSLAFARAIWSRHPFSTDHPRPRPKLLLNKICIGKEHVKLEIPLRRQARERLSCQEGRSFLSKRTWPREVPDMERTSWSGSPSYSSVVDPIGNGLVLIDLAPLEKNRAAGAGNQTGVPQPASILSLMDAIELIS